MRLQAVLLIGGLASLFLQATGRATSKDCIDGCVGLTDGIGTCRPDVICHDLQKRKPQGRFRGGSRLGHGESSAGESAAVPHVPHPPAHIANHATPADYRSPLVYKYWMTGVREGTTTHHNSGRKTYLETGQDLIAKMNAARAAEADAIISGPLIEFHKAATNTVRNARVKLEPRQVYESAATTIGMDLNKNWRHDEWVTTAGQTHISSTYFDTDSRTLVSAVSDNQNLKAEMTWSEEFTDRQAIEGLPFHSTIWADTYRDEMKASGVKYIIRAPIANAETAFMIEVARSVLRPDARDTDVVTLEINSSNKAEKEAFEALAGSDNGRTVFRMFADHHNLLKNVKVVKCHIWGPERGQEWEYPMLVWETDLVIPRPKL